MEVLALFVLLILGGGGRRGGGSGGGGGSDPRPPGSDKFGVPYARGSSSPLWPVEGGTSKTITTDFGDPRPHGSSSPERHHCGEDLPTSPGAWLVAVEDGRVVWIDPDWYNGNGAVMVALDSGIVVNYGEVDTSSIAVKKGARVSRGQRIAQRGTTGHLHFETYRKGTTRSHRWMWNDKPPAQLLDPTEYLRLAASGGAVS